MNLNYNKVKYLFYPLTKETIFFAEYFFKVQARAENEVTFIAPKGAALAEKIFIMLLTKRVPSISLYWIPITSKANF